MDRCDSTRLITHHPKGRCPGVPVYFLDPLSDHTDNMSLSQGLKSLRHNSSFPFPIPSLPCSPHPSTLRHPFHFPFSDLHYFYLCQGDYVFNRVCLLAGSRKTISGFSENPVERWHVRHGRNDWILVIMQITLRNG